MTKEEIIELKNTLQKYVSVLDPDEHEERDNARKVVEDIEKWLNLFGN